MIRRLFSHGFSRVVTLSFDDGQGQDNRVLDILRRYGLKGTFNLEGANPQNPAFTIYNGDSRAWDDSEDFRRTFRGMEIASHTLHHPHLTELPDEECFHEIKGDRDLLTQLARTAVRGFAAPYGNFDDRVIGFLKAAGLAYNRTTIPTRGFTLPEDFYRWNPTGHFVEFIGPKGDDLIRSFCETQEELPCLYIWGHSFELAHIDCYSPERWQGVVKRWDFFEDLCRRISALPDTWYATNIQIVDYVQAMRRAHITPVRIEISSDQTLYFELDGQKTPVAPGASLKL